jgi:quercetin dioxygenase-like cupin family protein
VTPEVLRLSPNSTLELRTSEPELLEVEATYEPGGGPPPMHLHPAQDEHFEVLQGTMRAVVGGEERTLEAGTRIDIPRETPHQMWNGGDATARVRWETRPGGRTEDFFREVDAVMPDDGGMPDLEPMLELLQRYDDTFRLVSE